MSSCSEHLPNVFFRKTLGNSYTGARNKDDCEPGHDERLAHTSPIPLRAYFNVMIEP